MNSLIDSKSVQAHSELCCWFNQCVLLDTVNMSLELGKNMSVWSLFLQIRLVQKWHTSPSTLFFLSLQHKRHSEKCQKYFFFVHALKGKGFLCPMTAVLSKISFTEENIHAGLEWRTIHFWLIYPIKLQCYCLLKSTCWIYLHNNNI